MFSYGPSPGLGNAGAASFSPGGLGAPAPAKFNPGPSMAARAGNSTRWTPGDWVSSNIDHYNSADASRQDSERIRNEAIRLIREREDK